MLIHRFDNNFDLLKDLRINRFVLIVLESGVQEVDLIRHDVVVSESKKLLDKLRFRQVFIVPREQSG
jgi:hypothetical protein